MADVSHVITASLLALPPEFTEEEMIAKGRVMEYVPGVYNPTDEPILVLLLPWSLIPEEVVKKF